MLGVMQSMDEFVSDAKSGLTKDQAQDPKTVASCEQNAKLMYYQTLLSHTDYVPLKIVEGAATAADYADILKQREEARQQINELMATNKASE